MKKIYNFIFIVAGLILGMSPAAFAQTSAEGIVLDKHVTQAPDENGVRWITLESFVTGAVKVVTGSKPSDVLLVLDVSTSMTKNNYGSVTRLKALIDAVNLFVGSIYDNAVSARVTDPNYKGNRIGIISFGGQYTDETEGWVNVESAVDKEGDTYSGSLIDIVNNLSTGESGTWTNVGLKRAIDLYLDGTPNEARDDANLTVVIFTDGEPATGGRQGTTVNMDGTSITSTGPDFNSYIANDAINYAYTLKQSKEQGGYGANVFTVALLGSDADARVPYFAEYLSSNYPSAIQNGALSSTWTYRNGSLAIGGDFSLGSKANPANYYQLVGNSDLSSIFEAIASQSGGSASSISEDAVVEVDVVSSSFTLPSGDLAEGYEPLIYVAKCTGYDSEGKGNTFDADNDGKDNEDQDDWIYIENTGEDGADNMTNVDGTTSHITIDINGNEISTTGFDFAKNWCGRRYLNDDEGKPIPSSAYADGYKLIVKIPIAVNDDAVGGAGTNTNEEGSGIKVNGVLIAEFPIPTISVPVNLWVMKTGLAKYENAHFSVYRCPVLTRTKTDGTIEYYEGEYETTPYTTFMLTGGLSEQTETIGEKTYTGPMLKLQGLSENYYYKVGRGGHSG